jgi:hypothetical protein
LSPPFKFYSEFNIQPFNENIYRLQDFRKFSASKSVEHGTGNKYWLPTVPSIVSFVYCPRISEMAGYVSDGRNKTRNFNSGGET